MFREREIMRADGADSVARLGRTRMRTAMRLLIIEDDRDAADYLVKAFREVGHVADRRRTARRAWRWRSTGNTTC